MNLSWSLHEKGTLCWLIFSTGCKSEICPQDNHILTEIENVCESAGGLEKTKQKITPNHFLIQCHHSCLSFEKSRIRRTKINAFFNKRTFYEIVKCSIFLPDKCKDLQTLNLTLSLFLLTLLNNDLFLVKAWSLQEVKKCRDFLKF